MKRLCLACLALLMIGIASAALAPAQAQALDPALDFFLADSFSETTKGVEALVATGDPRAASILEALAERRLYVVASTKAVVFQDAAGKTFDARSGAALEALPAEAAPLKINNKLRGVLQTALGGMTLQAADPSKRMDAAKAALRARAASSLKPLEAAIAAETVPEVKRAFELARAAVLLTDKTQPDADRAGAATLLGASGDQDAMNVLKEAQPAATGLVQQAVEAAISGAERARQIRDVGQTLWFGISLGSVLLLAAIGLAITFGVMGVINMAHGEMVMIGAYVTFVVQEVIRAHAPFLFDWSLTIAIPLAFLVAGAIGIAIERGIIRFLYGRPLETLLATFGVSLVLQQATRSWFGPTNREVGAPSFMSGSVDFLGLQITYGRLWIVVFSLFVFALLLLILRATSLGLQMRAVTQNRRMASSMGIRTGYVDAMTFGLGSGIAGIAGVALSQIDNVSPNLGQSYIIDSFLVVVFGGVGNLWGTLVAAMSLGVANKLLEPFAGAVLGKILILIAVILFIQKRPRGLFALKGRAVEA